MTATLTIDVALKAVDPQGICLLDFKQKGKQYVQTASGGPAGGYRSVGTTEESETFSELTEEGWLVMMNTDDTNYVEWGFSTGVYGGRLRPGRAAIIECNQATTIFLKADTAACDVILHCMRS